MTVDVKVCLRCKLPQEPASPNGMQAETTCGHCGYVYYGYDTARWPVYPPRCPFCDDPKMPDLHPGQSYICNKCDKRIYLGGNRRMYRYISPGALIMYVSIFALVMPVAIINILGAGRSFNSIGFLLMIVFNVLVSFWTSKRRRI